MMSKQPIESDIRRIPSMLLFAKDKDAGDSKGGCL